LKKKLESLPRKRACGKLLDVCPNGALKELQKPLRLPSSHSLILRCQFLLFAFDQILISLFGKVGSDIGVNSLSSVVFIGEFVCHSLLKSLGMDCFGFFAQPALAARLESVRRTHSGGIALYRSKVLDKRFGAPEEGVRRAVPGTRCADDVTPFVDAAGKVSESGCDPPRRSMTA
jgi:hypothetical protein